MIASMTRATAVLPIMAIGGVCLAAQGGDVQLCHQNAATNPDVAIRACTAAIGSGQLSGGDLAGASLDRGIAYLHKEDYDLAIRDFDQAIRGQPDLAAAFDRRCQAYLRKHDDARALPDCEQAIRLDPKAARPVYGRGLIRWHSGDHDRAALDFEQAIRLDPNLAVAYSGRASVHIRQGRYDQAIQDYGQALRLGPSSDAYLDRGWCYLQKRDYQSAEAALRDFDQAIRLQPNHAKGYTSRAQAHFSRGEYDQVIQDCGQALRLGPDAEAYYWRGWCYLRRGEYWGAMPDFDQAIRLAPNMAGAYRGRGYIYAVRHQYDLAIQAYDRALRINPDASDYQSRGWVYYQKGEYISALGDYVQATRRQPSILLRWPWTWLVALALLAYLFLRRQSAKLAEINRPRDDEALTPPAVSGEDQRELVVAETFVHWHDAKLARALLESANIPAYLADEHSQAADGGAGALGGMRLFVPAPFLEQARALLHTRVSDQDLAAQAAEDPS
jgi:tetratricopeptide (TPR) repeat protein